MSNPTVLFSFVSFGYYIRLLDLKDKSSEAVKTQSVELRLRNSS